MGDCISVKEWGEASSKLCNWLVQVDPAFRRTLNYYCDKSGTTFFTKNPPQNRPYVRIEDTDVYLITNYNAASLLAHMARGISLSAVSPYDVSIRLTLMNAVTDLPSPSGDINSRIGCSAMKATSWNAELNFADWDENQSYQFAKPRTLSLQGNLYSVKSWADATSKLVLHLIKEDPTLIQTLRNSCLRDGHRYIKTEKPKRAHVELLNTGLYLITNFDADDHMELMYWAISKSCFAHKDFSIFYFADRNKNNTASYAVSSSMASAYSELLPENNVMTVFRQLFAENGYCIGKIDEMKFASAYRDLFGESVDASAVNRTIQRLCLNVGDIYYDYDSVLDAETRGAVFENIENRLENGAPCVDAKVLLTMFDLHPLRSGDDLIAYLAHECPEYRHRGHFIGRDKLDDFDLVEAILEVVEEKGSCGLDDICEVLDDISPAEIQSAIKNMTEELVVDEKNKRCVPASHLYLEDDELDAVRSVIDDALEIDGTLTYGDFWDGIGEEMRERLSEFTEDGDPSILMQLIQIMFKDAYSLTKQAIGILGQSRNINDILEQAFGYRSKVEMSEIEEVVDKNKLRNYQPTVFQYFYDHFIRINESEFIADAMLTFDCEKIDMALDGQVSNDYMLLENIDVYSLPTLGVPWNIFLLSSYLYRFSQRYCIMNNTLTTKQGRGGAIVKQGTIKNYDALVVDYLIHLDSFPDSAREAELVLKSSGLISRWSDKTLRLYERAVKERNL